jgi:hypothetical protein
MSATATTKGSTMSRYIAPRLRELALSFAACAALATPPSFAHLDASDASALSALPVAVSVAAPASRLVGGAALTVVSAQASAAGTVWVLERAADGARASLHVAGHAASASLAGVGAAAVVTALSAGWLVSVAGQAIAFVPNEVGAYLLYNERVTR